MKQSRVSAFARVVRWSGRFGRVAVLAAVALALGAGSLFAQGSTGKLEGRVRDQTGAPIANAQVLIVGTAYSATTNNQGYYFINNVPAGVLDVRAQFVGYRPTQVTNVRMLAGQTITQDVTMEASAVEITDLVVTEAIQPLVPRDEVTTKQRISGEFTAKLPVDRINQVLALQPGVVASTSGNTLSIRGSRSDESATYIDGVPTQRGQRGTGFVDGSGSSGVVIGKGGFEEASITTGASSSEFGNAQAGIISFQTRGGSPTAYSGGLSFETDEPFGKSAGVGYNRIAGSLGGPTRLMDNLTFYVSGVLEGQKSGAPGTFPGIRSQDEPVFVRAGIDTIVANASGADTVFNYAVARGECDAFSGSTNSDIANNYGVDCTGIRSPNSHGSAYQVQGKLGYSYGSGSRVALTLIGSQTLGRLFSLANLYNDDLQFGNQTRGRYAILNWTQNLTKSTERALALETNLSIQADRFLQSPLEGAAPDPGFLGFRVAPYDFRFDYDQWDGEAIEFNDDLIAAYRRNDQTQPRAPCILPVADPSDCNVVNRVRNNPYGTTGFNEGGGPVGRFQMYRENRLVGRSVLDWQFDRYNRIRAGGEVTKYDIDFYSHQINSQAFSDAYMEEPIRYAFFAEDRLDLGDVVLIGGLRYDYYNSRASRPYFVCDGTQDAADGNVDGTCGGVLELGERQIFPRISTSPNVVGAADPDAAIEAIYFEDESHDYLSPHIQVSFPVTDRTNFRLSYAHQVQAPDFGLILGGINTDLAITNTNNVFGTDLDFGRTISFEFGIRHAFSDDMVLDVAAYNRDNLANAAGRLVRLYDPFRRNETDIRLLQNADFGNARGVDLRLDRRFGNLFNGTVAYSYSTAKNTGSDPFTYINFGSRVINQLSGGNAPPPQAIAPTSLSRPHVLAGAMSLTFPNDWNEGSAVGTVLQNSSIFATFRYQSGTAYTLCETEAGNEGVFSGQVCAEGGFDGGLNAARLPAFKDLSMVFRKGFSLGGFDATAYLDARNMLNFRNITSVFVATSDIRNEAERVINFAGDSAQFASQGIENGIYGGDGSLDVSFGGTGTAGCGGFVNDGGQTAVADCVYLIRAEERYGNGDGVFTLAEQQAASDALYMVNRGVSSFTGDGRRLRVGLELNF